MNSLYDKTNYECLKFLDNIIKTEEVAKDPESIIHGYYADLKNHLNIIRDKIKDTIEGHFIELRGNIEISENECLKRFKSLSCYKIEIEEFKNIYEDYKHKLKHQSKSNQTKLDTLNQSISFSNKLLKEKIDLFRNDVLDHKYLQIESKIDGSVLESIAKLVKYGDDEKRYDLISSSEDKTIKFWDLERDKCYKTLDCEDLIVLCIELLSKDTLVGSCPKGKIKVWDIKNEQCIKNFNVSSTENIHHLLKLNENEFVSGSEDGQLRIWNYKNDHFDKTLDNKGDPINSLKLFMNNKLITGSGSKIKIWDIETGECVKSLKGHTEAVNDLAITKSKILVSCSNDKSLRIWDLDNYECLKTIHSDNPIKKIELMEDKKMLVLSQNKSAKQNLLEIFDMNDYSKSVKKMLPNRSIENIRLLSNKKLITYSSDGLVEFWDLDNLECLKMLRGHKLPITKVLLLDKS